ncbi:hypothetical protein MGYG_05649 [Nannizzia gypsea CBS 118893]|uniref:BZIP domain-containing protein n=1 Tax=Arthroderma gypseum (strain ATCC MYA-4604 / CBS 118893) TaxID=535722 RepID=E4UX13_ARTGP|nr:hypothetical protein MGYG_05649 [Nannizzia gypsea CBS 118893]EFR02652.1 hypothetical protein MGYG_05649 [Nannizzia gypsea CBS 118893]
MAMAMNPAAARVRENQRRSRARRKEYIQELETRLQQYERHGVGVTIEVQTAARKVSRQNAMLRSLLHSCGVTDARIDECLAYAEENNCSPSIVFDTLPLAAAAAPKPRRAPKPKPAPEPQPSLPRVLAPAPAPATVAPAVSPAVEQRTAAPMLARRPPSACCRPQQGSQGCPAQVAEGVPNFVPPQTWSASSLDSTHSPMEAAIPSSNCASAPDLASQWIDDMTPCEEAAKIIASMRVEQDEQAVRAELGCGLNATCMVDNMTIFQAMDRW